MKKDFQTTKRQSRAKRVNEPRVIGDIINEMFQTTKKGNAGEDPSNNFFVNTDLCVDVKTYLRNTPITVLGKNYPGLLTRDKECHYTFRELSSVSALVKRNPHLFVGEYITITRRDDGSLRLNFRPVSMGPDFNPATFASNVANELLWSLSSLLEK